MGFRDTTYPNFSKVGHEIAKAFQLSQVNDGFYLSLTGKAVPAYEIGRAAFHGAWMLIKEEEKRKEKEDEIQTETQEL